MKKQEYKPIIENFNPLYDEAEPHEKKDSFTPQTNVKQLGTKWLNFYTYIRCPLTIIYSLLSMLSLEKNEILLLSLDEFSIKICLFINILVPVVIMIGLIFLWKFALYLTITYSIFEIIVSCYFITNVVAIMPRLVFMVLNIVYFYKRYSLFTPLKKSQKEELSQPLKTQPRNFKNNISNQSENRERKKEKSHGNSTEIPRNNRGKSTENSTGNALIENKEIENKENTLLTESTKESPPAQKNNADTSATTNTADITWAFCRHCGKPLIPNSLYCRKCGTKIANGGNQ